MLDARRSLLGELVDSILQLIAQPLDHVAADEETSPIRIVSKIRLSQWMSITYLLNP
jgi:hypothetical protein